MSKFPAQIDNDISLPRVTDNFSAARGDFINKLRSAIIAIEEELGIKPSNIYSTVRARIDTLENALNSLEIISLAGDLGGTLENPLVIGFQGYPVSDVAPELNQFLVWNALAWVPNDGYLSGDLDGYLLSSPTVVGIRGAPISETAPTYGQVLTWDGYSWIPGEPVGAPGADGPPGPNAAFVFDGGSSTQNARADRSENQSPIDNTKDGIVNLSSDTSGSSIGVTGNYSTITGGDINAVGDNDYCFVGSGAGNSIADGDGYNSIVGGDANSIGAGRGWDVIGGGYQNVITAGDGWEAVIAGGESNSIDGYSTYPTIGGGKSNVISSGEDGSTIGGGNGNHIEGTATTSCTISGGLQNYIQSGNTASIAGGQGNVINGDFGFAVGLNNAVTDATANSSAIAMGQSNIASARAAIATGFYSTASRVGQKSHAASRIGGVQASAQSIELVPSGVSASGVAVNLTFEGGGEIVLTNSRAYAFNIQVIANQANGSNRAMFVKDLLVHCSGSTAFIDNDNDTLTILNGTTWTFTVTATEQTLRLTGTGTAGQNVNFVATVRGTECVGQ